MMELARAGDKLTINHRGIFKRFSQDRYELLRHLLPLLEMLRKLASIKASVSISHSNLTLNDKELLDRLINSDDKKMESLYKYMGDYSNKIDSDLVNVQEAKYLSDMEKSIYVANIKLMRDYLMQRRFNKALYHLCIDEARDIVLHKEIVSIVTSSNNEYMHILNSLKNDIKAFRTSSAIKVVRFFEAEKDYLLLINPNYI